MLVVVWFDFHHHSHQSILTEPVKWSEYTNKDEFQKLQKAPFNVYSLMVKLLLIGPWKDARNTEIVGSCTCLWFKPNELGYDI